MPWQAAERVPEALFRHEGPSGNPQVPTHLRFETNNIQQDILTNLWLRSENQFEIKQISVFFQERKDKTEDDNERAVAPVEQEKNLHF